VNLHKTQVAARAEVSKSIEGNANLKKNKKFFTNYTIQYCKQSVHVIRNHLGLQAVIE